MKLPDGERAIVDIRKLLDYCLNPQHPRGRNKARVFAAIGLHESDAEELRAAILSAGTLRRSWAPRASMGNATSLISTCSVTDERFEFAALGLWRPEGGLPQLTSCYVL